MVQNFSWQHFDRMAKMVEALGYFSMVLGPLFGLGFIVFGSGWFRLFGLAVFFGSIVVSLYHISISYIMYGLKQLSEKDPIKTEEPITIVKHDG